VDCEEIGCAQRGKDKIEWFISVLTLIIVENHQNIINIQLRLSELL